LSLRHGMAFYQDAFVSHSDLPVALKYSDSGSISKLQSHARVGQESRKKCKKASRFRNGSAIGYLQTRSLRSTSPVS